MKKLLEKQNSDSENEENEEEKNKEEFLWILYFLKTANYYD